MVAPVFVPKVRAGKMEDVPNFKINAYRRVKSKPDDGEDFYFIL